MYVTHRCSVYVCVSLCWQRVTDPWRSMWSLCLVGVIQILCSWSIGPYNVRFCFVFWGGWTVALLFVENCTVEKLKYFVGFYTLFPALDIPLSLMLALEITRRDWGSTPEGIRAHSHRCILSLWFNALYNLYDTIILFSFLFCLISRGARMEVIDGLAVLVTKR